MENTGKPPYTQPNSSLKRQYAGNKVYENSVLKKILLPNGYFENGNYYFYLRDHLGNNCVVANANGEIQQSSHYYPFGKVNEYESGGQSFQPYKFGGKEDEPMFGLGLYDFEARQLDKVVPRFTTMDPLAEKYYSISPYAYCANNPVRFVDPTGMRKIDPVPGTLPNPQREVNVDEISTQEAQKEGFLTILSNGFKSFLFGDMDNPPPDLQGADLAQFQLEELEQGGARAESAANYIEALTDGMTAIHPFGSAIEMIAKAATGQEITAVDAAFAIAEIVPVGKIAKVGEIAKFADKAGDAAKGGTKAVNGIQITGFTKHGLNRAIERGVKPSGIIDAVRNPLKTGNVVIDQFGRSSQRFVGKSGEVVINPQTGQIISVNPTSTNKVDKLTKQLGK
ncbi:RHS repeat domain-containing protein [Viscerimonas tarda]